MEHVDDGDTSCNWCTWSDPQCLGKESGIFGNQRTSRDHPNSSIFKIAQYTPKGPVDLRFVITQTPVKKY